MRLPGERELSENRPTQSSRREPVSKGQKVEEEVQGKLRRRRARGVGGTQDSVRSGEWAQWQMWLRDKAVRTKYPLDLAFMTLIWY